MLAHRLSRALSAAIGWSNGKLIVHDMAPFAFWLSDAQQNIRCCANPYKQ
jgi:hypothetical protein